MKKLNFEKIAKTESHVENEIKKLANEIVNDDFINDLELAKYAKIYLFIELNFNEDYIDYDTGWDVYTPEQRTQNVEEALYLSKIRDPWIYEEFMEIYNEM